MADLAQFISTPLAGLDYSFSNYLKKKKFEMSRHMLGNGITDYAYKLDLELRKKIDAVPGLYKIAKKMYSTVVNMELQNANMSYVAVGPYQMPEIYDIACDCAKRLGIAVPHIYVNNTETVNAGAYAIDDIEPFIVVTNLMVKRFSIGELKAVIGHECGHIQNNHVLYNFIAQDIISGTQMAAYGLAASLMSQLQALLTKGIQLTFNMWSRAAEVTADRAGMICCDDIDDCYNVDKKLMYGGVDLGGKVNTDFDIESLKEQLKFSTDNLSRLLELYTDHPLSIKRILASMEFARCETLYSWRPDLRQPGITTVSKETCDDRCKRFIDVARKESKR